MTNTTNYSTELAFALNGYLALMVPDLNNSNENHWMTLWEKSLPRSRRIRLQDWNSADWVKWRNSIIASLISLDEPVVLIAEGFGALAAASVAAEYPGKVMAVFLVDPADPDKFDLRKKMPKQSLAVPTAIIVRKHNNAPDDAKAAWQALLWNSSFSHPISNTTTFDSTQSDYWHQGIQALSGLIEKIQRKPEEITRSRAKKVLAELSLMSRANTPHHFQYNYN